MFCKISLCGGDMSEEVVEVKKPVFQTNAVKFPEIKPGKIPLPKIVNQMSLKQMAFRRVSTP